MAQKFEWQKDSVVKLNGAEWQHLNDLITVLTSDEASEYSKHAVLYEFTKLMPPIFGRLIDEGVVTVIDDEVITDEKV